MSITIPKKIQTILEEAERLKKIADLEFARSKFNDAINSYTNALLSLSPLRTTPYGELCALRCFSNQIQCHLRLNENEKAIGIAQYALTIPITTTEIHLTQKILIRYSQALENLKYYEQALNIIDKAISLDANSTDLDSIRDRLIYLIHGDINQIIPISPRPLDFAPIEVSKVIGEILKSRGDPEPLVPLFNELCVHRVFLDKRDEKNYNIMWALCQASCLRAANPEENPDDVYPLLQLILMNGSNPEQRFISVDNEKNDRTSNQTPLMLFSLAGAVDCAKLLIQNGANVLTCDGEGWTPLMVACAPGSPRRSPESITTGRPATNDEMVEMLINAKSPINIQNYQGLTPLACAAQAGDLQAVAVLIHAGATMNLRSSNGFSPIVWALTSTVPNHEMVQLLLDACLTPISIEKEGEEGGKSDIMTPEEREELQKEYVEDIKCYKLGHLVLNLKILVKEFITTYQNTQKAVGKEISPPAAYLIQRKIAEAIGRITNVVVDAGGPRDLSSKYLTTVSSIGLYSNILEHLNQQFLPDTLFKKWTPVDDPKIAVMSAPILDQARLSIMMKGATGPQTKEPPLSHTQPHNYLMCGRYPDYRILLRESLVGVFSACVPSINALNYIVQNTSQYIVIVLNIGTDYWVKNIQEINKSVTFDIKLVRSTCPNFYPPYFIPNTGIEVVQSLTTFNERTLVMIWPMCNMISSSSRELVEKDEELLLSYRGNKIILIGDINYNPLTRATTVKDYIQSNYECIETMPLPNWKEFENTVTVWVKLS